MRIIFLFSCLLTYQCLFAQYDKQQKVDAQYFIDTNNVWNAATVNAMPFIAFSKNQHLSIGYNLNTTVWCRFTISNQDSIHSSSKWLCFYNNHIDSLILYDGTTIQVLGDRTNQPSPYLSAQAFEVTLQPKQQQTFLVKIKKGISFLNFTYGIADEKVLAKKSNLKISIVSFFLGIIFLLMLFNVGLFILTRNKIHIYYLTYSLLTALYILISSSFAKNLLFTNFLNFSELRVYTASCWFISISIFLSNFLNLKELQPLKYRVIYILNIANILIIIATIILLNYHELNYFRLLFNVGYINFVIIIIVLFWSVIIQISTNKKKGLYALLAFFPQCVWGMWIILKSFEVIHQSIQEDWLVIISFYEALLFGYILAQNYFDAFKINNKLTQQVMDEKGNSIKAITMAQIRERRKIANIIHDNLGSKIAYILQLLQLKNNSVAIENMKELASYIREISHSILPKSLDEGALAASIKSQITSLNGSMSNTSIELYQYNFPEKIAENWVFDLYLISLEIITNSIKHGQPTLINIDLFGYPASYQFQFTDDGIGFDVATTPKGFGLENIEKRILFFKGTFEISSSKQGTIVQISIPKK